MGCGIEAAGQPTATLQQPIRKRAAHCMDDIIINDNAYNFVKKNGGSKFCIPAFL
jgi:hypothetical protein